MRGWQCCSTTTQASTDCLDYTAIMPCSGRSGYIRSRNIFKMHFVSLTQPHICNICKSGLDSLILLICLLLSSTAFWLWSLLNVLPKYFPPYFSLILWLVSLMISLHTSCKIWLWMQHFSSVKTEEWLITTYFFVTHRDVTQSQDQTKDQKMNLPWWHSTLKKRKKETWIPH